MSKTITLITGAERGMGLVTAKALGQAGQQIIIAAYNMELGAEAVKELAELGVEADLYKCDVTNRDDIAALVKAIDEKYGYLNILINNAGIAGPMTPPSQTSEKDLRMTMETNFFGATAMVQECLPLLKKAEFGKIINITSDLGSLTLASDKNHPLYAFNAFLPQVQAQHGLQRLRRRAAAGCGRRGNQGPRRLRRDGHHERPAPDAHDALGRRGRQDPRGAQRFERQQRITHTDP